MRIDMFSNLFSLLVYFLFNLFSPINHNFSSVSSPRVPHSTQSPLLTLHCLPAIRPSASAPVPLKVRRSPLCVIDIHYLRHIFNDIEPSYKFHCPDTVFLPTDRQFFKSICLLLIANNLNLFFYETFANREQIT